MGGVSSLKPVLAQPDAEVISLLERALDLARDGHLRSVALVGLTADQSVYTAYSVQDIPLMIGQIEMVKIQLMRSPDGTIR